MKAYQLTVLCLAFFGNNALALPTPQDEPPVRYMSKYPQHPLNQGSGDDYPKYWLGEGPLGAALSGKKKAPAAMPPPAFSSNLAFTPPPGWQQHQAAPAPLYGQTSDAYNQPRQLFVPYPYSESWNTVQNPAPVQPEPEVPTYSPPRGFPTERGAAKAAIAHYSAVKAAEDAAAAGEAPPAAPGAAPPAKPIEPAGDLALVKNEDGSKTLGFGSEFSGYQKAPPAHPQPEQQIGVMPEHWDEVSYSYTDVRKNLEDIPVIRENTVPNPYLTNQAQKRRKNAALEKLEGFLAPEEQSDWHVMMKRDTIPAPPPSAAKAPASKAAAPQAPAAVAAPQASSAAPEKPKVIEGAAFAKESEWPAHIKTKAQKMMEQAEMMQKKGTLMAADDPRNKKLAEEKKDDPPTAITPKEDEDSGSDSDMDDLAERIGGRVAGSDDESSGSDSGSDSEEEKVLVIIKRPYSDHPDYKPPQQQQQRPVQMQVKKPAAAKPAPVKAAPVRYAPIGMLDDDTEEEEEEDYSNVYPPPVRKSASQWPPRNPRKKAMMRNPYGNDDIAFTPPPPPAPRFKRPAPAPAVPGPNNKKQQEIPLPLPTPSKSKEDLDPLMRGELPDRSGRTKAPKKPKSARNRQVSEPPVVAGPKKTKEKARKQNDNMPNQTNSRPRLQNVKRDVEDVELVDDVAQEHLAQFMLKRPDRMKKIEKIDAKKAPLVGGTKKGQSPHQGSKSNGGPGISNNGSRGPLSSTSGRNRPSLNQDRPGKKKDQGRKKSPQQQQQLEKRDASVSTPRRKYPAEKKRPDGKIYTNRKGTTMPPYFGGPLPTPWVLSHAEREQAAASVSALDLPAPTTWDGYLFKRSAAADPEADPDAQNRRVLPMGPPVTVRRVLGPNDPLPTHHASNYIHHEPAVRHEVLHHPAPVQQIPDGQIQAQPEAPDLFRPFEDGYVIGHKDVIQQIPDGQIQAQQLAIAQQNENADRAAHGLPPIDFVVPVWPPIGASAATTAVQPAAPVIVSGPTVTVTVPGPIQYIDRPQVIEKVVTRVETIQAPPQVHYQTVQAPPQVFYETVRIPERHELTVVQSVPYKVEHTVVQSVPYKVAHTIHHSVPYRVVETETVVNLARETVVEKQKVPYAVQVIETVKFPVTQVETVNQVQTIGVTVPVQVVSEHTQTVPAVPVRTTITPAAVTRLATMVVSAPGKTKIKTVEAPGTKTVVQTVEQTATSFATSFTTVEVPGPTKVVERVQVPQERAKPPVAVGEAVRESIKEIVEEIETTEYVPVVKTVSICPICEETEEYCGCGTNFSGGGGKKKSGGGGGGGCGDDEPSFPGEVNNMEQVEGIEDGVHQEVMEAVGYMSSLAGIPRDPAAIEAFVRGRIPGNGGN